MKSAAVAEAVTRGMLSLTDACATAMDGVRKIVRDLDDAELLTWWKGLDRDAAE